MALLISVSTPPESANKDEDEEQAELTAESHARLFSGGLLPACLRVSDAMDAAATAASQAALLLAGSLQVPRQILTTLRGYQVGKQRAEDSSSVVVVAWHTGCLWLCLCSDVGCEAAKRGHCVGWHGLLCRALAALLAEIRPTKRT